jgi:hypothetical protein
VFAQATSSLRGKVTDAQGGALPGVTVVLKNAETAFSRRSSPTRRGRIRCSRCRQEAFTITAELPGLPDRQREDRAAGQHAATLDLKMDIGGITESVKVEARSRW